MSLRNLQPGDAVAPVYLSACLLLGGASAAGVIANALLQGTAVILLAVAARRTSVTANPLGTRGFAWLVAMTIALVLYQLVPLPAALWSHLPGRGDIVAGYRLMGIPLPVLPLSLDVDGTMASGLALLPPLAMAVAAIAASRQSRLLSLGVVAIVAVLSIIVGALQVSGGPGSPFYFYKITNPTSAVGFFSNSNHLATLLLMSLPCVVTFIASGRVSRQRRDANGRRFGLLALGLFFCFGLMLNHSLAGVSMLLPVALACFALWRRDTQKALSGRQVGACAVGALLVMGLVFAGPIGGRFMEKTLSVKDPVTRRTTNALTLKAALDHLPLGTGLGTFMPIYAGYENHQTISTTYVNHAHDDYAELFLETGLPGVALLCAWLVWYGRRARAVWSGDAAAGSIGRAASLMVGVVLVHSLVDYPARTSAIAAVLGLALGILAVPMTKSPAAPRSRTGARHARAD